VREGNPGKTVRLFVSDEARVGQKGTLTRVWAPTGSRPTLVKQCEYDWLYLWAAVDAMTGDSIAMITPTVDTGLMQMFIDGLSGHIKADEHAVLVLDNAGWHHAGALRWPANVTPMYLPAYSPELNPAENVWQFLRSHHLSNQVFDNYDSMLRRTDAAWTTLDPPRLRSLCRCPWIERALQA
jgi:transposase